MGTRSVPGRPNSIVRSSVDFQGLSPYQKWELANVVRGRANGTVSAYAWCRLGDITAEQFRGLAQIQRDFGVEIRITNRQNFALRDLSEEQLPDLYERLGGSTWPKPAPSSPATSCPARAPTPATSRSRSHAASRPTSARHSRTPGSPRSAGSASTSPAARTRAVNTTSPTSASSASSAAAHGRAAPGYQMELGGRVGDMEIEFGEKATKLPAKSASEAVVRVVGHFAGERDAGETFGDVAGPRRWCRGGRHHAEGARRVPDSRRGARLLHRLRRDRSVRGRDRRQRVRDMSRRRPFIESQDAGEPHSRRSPTSASSPRSRRSSRRSPRAKPSLGVGPLR